jgi:hypothetical protein
MFSDTSGSAAARRAFLPQENLLRYGNLQGQANKEIRLPTKARPPLLKLPIARSEAY